MPKTKRTRRTIPLDAKIKDAQDAVIRTKMRYEKALEKLKVLMARRNEARQKEIMAALEKSNRTFEDVMRFLKC